MSKRARVVVNFIAGTWILLIAIDHFLSYTYRHLFMEAYRVHLSQYVEVISLVITVAVPFFYGLYKRRENWLEEQAVGEAGGVKDLRRARQRFDLTAFAFYALAGFSLIVCLFLQSTILNAEKIESKIQEQKISEIHDSLQTIKALLIQKTEEIQSILRNESLNLETVREKLNAALTYVPDIGRRIDTALELAKLQPVSFEPPDRLIQFAGTPQDTAQPGGVRRIMAKLDSIQFLLNQSLGFSKANFGNITRALDSMTEEIGMRSATVPEASPATEVPPEAVAPKLKSSVLDDWSVATLGTLLEILDGYEARHGPVPVLIAETESKEFYPKFKKFIEQERKISKGDFHNRLKMCSTMLQKAQQNVPVLEKELGVANLEKKLKDLQWLKWRTGYTW